jgi:hypothetical protein
MVVGTRRSSINLPKSPSTPSTPPRRPPTPSTGTKSTPSSRNKVVPSRPSITSPPTAKYPSTPDSENDESSQGSYISSTDRKGLPSFLQKQLAIDIEKVGGIKNLAETNTHVLHSIVDQRPDIYGRPGDPRRARIQKKVWTWKQLHKEGKYIEKVLNRFQVKSFDTLQFEERNRKRNPRKIAEEEPSISSSSDSESISSGDSSVSNQEPTLQERTPPPRVIDTRIPQTRIPQGIDKTKMPMSPRSTPNTPVPKGAGKLLLVFVFGLLLVLLICSSYMYYLQHKSSSTSITLRGIGRCWSFL